MVSGKVLKERQHCRQASLQWRLDWNGKLMMKPELHLRGVVTSIDRTLVQSGCKNRLKQSLSDRWTDFARSLNGEQVGRLGWTAVQLERELQRGIRRELHCQPSVTLLMQTPDER